MTAPKSEAGPPTVPVGRFEWERIVREDDTLSTKMKAVAFVFATHASTSQGDKIFPGNEQLAHGASMSLATFKRHRDELVRRGLISKVKRGNRHRNLADEWRLSMPDLLSADDESPAADGPVVLDAGYDVAQPFPGAGKVVGTSKSQTDRHPNEDIPTPYERARRRVAEAFSGLDEGTPEYEQARVDLAHDLSQRVSGAEVRDLLGMSELEYRAAMRQRRSA